MIYHCCFCEHPCLGELAKDGSGKGFTEQDRNESINSIREVAMEPKAINDADYEKHLSATAAGIILFHKKLCPHCLNMKKVIDKFSAAFNGEVAVMYIDSEENEKAMQALEVERVPTILVIKQGKVSAKKTGLMNPKELKALYTNA